MSRDYKPRNLDEKTGRRRDQFGQKSGIGLWKWMLITAIIILFAVFLVYLRSNSAKHLAETAGLEKANASKGEHKPEVKTGPQFDFYTLLPEKEVVVPEYEIKTRAREERVGKAKATHYIIQVGSTFNTFKEADQLRIKLAAMGLVSKVEKGKVGTANWYRVKMGSYAKTDSINAISARLKQRGIAAIITEVND